MQYQVEVTEPLPPDLELAAERVASIFGIKTAKIRALLERAPGVVTKPIGEREASRVIDAFTRTGIWARLLPYEIDSSGGLDYFSDSAGNNLRDTPEVEPGPAAEPVLVVPEEPEIVHQDPEPFYEPEAAAELEAFYELEATVEPEAFYEPEAAVEPEAFYEPEAAVEPEAFYEPEAAVEPEAFYEPEAAVEPEAATEPPYRSPFLSGVYEPELARADSGVPLFAPGMTDPNGPPAFVREPAEAGHSTPKAHRGRDEQAGSWRSGLRLKVLLAGLIPALLVAVFALAAVALTVQPALRAQQADVAAGVAGAFAGAVAPLFSDTSTPEGDVVALQRAVLEGRADLINAGVTFLLIADASGTPLVGWSQTGLGTEAAVGNRTAAVEAELQRLLGPSVILEGSVSSDLVSEVDEGALVSVPILVSGQPVGAVVIGTARGETGRRALVVVLITFAATMIPLLIAVIVSSTLTTSLMRNLLYLTKAADRISRGRMSRPVELDTRDELSELAKAIERMRISLQEGMERLRRRRK